MGAGHAHALYVHEHSRLHHMAPEAKVLGAFALVTAVALTPPEAGWAFVAHGAIVLLLLRAGRLRPGFVARRAAVVIPFLLVGVLIPFVATGERTEVLGVAVSAEGLVAARGIIAKALVGVCTSVALAGTTEVPAIMRGLDRLRVPPVLTSIATFMIRYLEVLSGELGRTRTAMAARGYDPRWLWQAKPIATSAGALFVRAYERGERVHAAMLSRGFTGVMPTLDERRATTAEWALALVPAALAATATAAALLLV